MIIVKEHGARRRLSSFQRAEGAAVEQVNIEPAVVIVIEESHTGAGRVDNRADVVLAQRPENLPHLDADFLGCGLGGLGALGGLLDRADALVSEGAENHECRHEGLLKKGGPKRRPGLQH